MAEPEQLNANAAFSCRVSRWPERVLASVRFDRGGYTIKGCRPRVGGIVVSGQSWSGQDRSDDYDQNSSTAYKSV